MELTQSDALLVTGTEAGTLRVLCTQTGDTDLSIVAAHRGAITCLKLNSSDTVVATGIACCTQYQTHLSIFNNGNVCAAF